MGNMKVYDLNIALSNPEAVTALYLSNRNFDQFPAAVLKLNMLEVLDLSACQIKELPSAIADLHHLHTLVLDNNALQSLPASIGQLSLRVLSLAANRFTALPEAITRMTTLRELSMANNGLQELPDALFDLKHLTRLDLSINQLTLLPQSIKRLQALRRLHLDINRLSALPLGLFQCQKLEELRLNANQLTKIPAAIGKLEALENLYLGNNALSTLPVELGHCQNLRRLHLGQNKLRKLPEFEPPFNYLIQLHVCKNQLTQLPVWLRHCTRLEEIDLSGNAFRKLPEFLTELPRLTQLDASYNNLRKWPALPNTLTKLHLNKNPISSIPATIGQLTRLRDLSLDGTKLQRLPDNMGELQALQALSGQGVLLKTLPKSLLSLHGIAHFAGFLEYNSIVLVRELWEITREAPLPAHVLKPLYDALDGKTGALSKVSVQALFSLLNQEDLAFLIRSELFRRSQAKPNGALEAGKVLYCAGTPLFDLATLPARVEKQGIEYAPRPSHKITHVLLGQAPEFHPALAKRNLIFINERELTRFLDQAEQRPLVVDLVPEALENLRQLLLHKDPVNIEIALRMMQAGGVPEPLFNELLAIVLSRRLRLPDYLQALVRDLLLLNLSEQDRQLLSIRRRMFFLEEPSALHPGETITGMENLLRNSAFDAKRILQIFKENFGR